MTSSNSGLEQRVPPPTADRRGMLASLALGMLLPSVGASMAHVALPTLAQALGATFQQVQWVGLAYLLATTTLVVGAGRLGDLVGRKRLLLAGIALFTAASAACSLAPSLALLVAARAVQGAGAAVMMALTLAFVGDAVPRSRTGRAMGLLGTLSAVGTALGPSLGGLLVTGGGWPALFALHVPLGLLAGGLAWRCLPADAMRGLRPRPRFDLAGTLLLALTLCAYALAATLGHGRLGALNAGLLCLAAVGMVLFMRTEARVPAPLIPLAMLRQPVLRAGLLASAVAATVVMATLVVGPFYLARTLHLPIAWVGLAMSVGPLVAALAGLPAGRAVDRFGPRRTAAVGLAAMLAGSLALAAASPALGLAGYLVPMACLTAGHAGFQAANNTQVMADLAADQRGVVSGLLNLSRNLGLVTGTAVMGVVFAAATGHGDANAASAVAVGAGMRVTMGVAAGGLALALVARSSRWAVAPRARGGALPGRLRAWRRRAARR